MADPLSIASGVAGIITLSSAVVAAGFKYFSSVGSAPADLKNLVREISLLHTLVSQFATQSLDTGQAPHKALDALVDQAVFEDCFATLRQYRNIWIIVSCYKEAPARMPSES